MYSSIKHWTGGTGVSVLVSEVLRAEQCAVYSGDLAGVVLFVAKRTGRCTFNAITADVESVLHVMLLEHRCLWVFFCLICLRRPSLCVVGCTDVMGLRKSSVLLSWSAEHNYISGESQD